MEEAAKEQNIWILIVSIIVAALIVRIIYVFFDAAKVLVEEVFDDDNDIPYDRSSYYIVNAVLVILVCLFLLVLVYQWYVVGYIEQIGRTSRIGGNGDMPNTNPVTIASAAIEGSPAAQGSGIDAGRIR